MLTNLGQLDRSKIYTWSDYLNWDFPQRVEIILGKVFVMSPAPNTNHQDISAWLGYQMMGYFKSHRCRIFMAPFDVVLPGRPGSPESVLQPDICVVCDENKIQKKRCYGPPDLVVEILSPSTRRKDLNQKRMLYESYGVREYWVVDPEMPEIQSYIPDESGRFRTSAKVGRGKVLRSHCFPELEVDVDFIFRNIVSEPQHGYRRIRKKESRRMGRKMVRI